MIISSQSIAVDAAGYSPFCVDATISGAAAGALVYATYAQTTNKRSLALEAGQGSVLYGIVSRVIESTAGAVEIIVRGEFDARGLSLNDKQVDQLQAIGIYARA